MKVYEKYDFACRREEMGVLYPFWSSNNIEEVYDKELKFMSDYHAIYKDTESPASLYDDPTTEIDDSIMGRSIAIIGDDQVVACCKI